MAFPRRAEVFVSIKKVLRSSPIGRQAGQSFKKVKIFFGRLTHSRPGNFARFPLPDGAVFDLNQSSIPGDC